MSEENRRYLLILPALREACDAGYGRTVSRVFLCPMITQTTAICRACPSPGVVLA